MTSQTTRHNSKGPVVKLERSNTNYDPWTLFFLQNIHPYGIGENYYKKLTVHQKLSTRNNYQPLKQDHNIIWHTAVEYFTKGPILHEIHGGHGPYKRWRQLIHR